MKIILASKVTYPYHKYDGTARYVYGLGKHLVKKGVEVEILAPPGDPDEVSEDGFEGINYNIIEPAVKPGKYFGFVRSYHQFNINATKALKDKEFDLLHLFEITCWNYLLKKKRKPVVAQPFHRGTEPWKPKTIAKKIFDLPISLPLKYCLTRSEAVAAEGNIQSKKLMQEYGIPEEKIINLPDGVDLKEIEENIKESPLVREDLGITDKDFVIISVGRLQPEKGATHLIKALKILKEKIPEIKLIQVGAGSEEERIHNLVHEHSLVDNFEPHKNLTDEQLFGCYSLADVFVTPTLYEGLPQVVLEAMATGLPIVATNTGENPQVVEEGVNGYLIPPKDPKAIAEAVMKMRDEGRIQEMGEKSREKIKEYDWNNIAEKALRGYEKLLP